MRALIVSILTFVLASSAIPADRYPLSSVRYERPSTGPNGEITVVSDDSGFLAFFGDRAVRISSTGEILDTVPRRIKSGAGSDNPVAIWIGDCYLYARALPDGKHIGVTRRDRNGERAGDEETVLSGGPPRKFVRAGSNFLLISGNESPCANVFDGSGRPLRECVLIAKQSWFQAAASISAGALLLTTGPLFGQQALHALVINERGDVIRDHVVPSHFPGNIAMVSSSAGAVAAWSSGHDLESTSFDENGDVVQTTKITSEPKDLSIRGAVALEDGILLYGQMSNYVSGTILLSRNGTVARSWIDSPVYIWELASNGVSALAIHLTNRGFAALQMHADASMGALNEFPPLPSSQVYPAIACGSSDCMAVWSESNRDGSYSVRANALDSEGKPTSADAIELSNGPGYFAAIARSRNHYLVVWQPGEFVYGGGPIFARRVSPSGELLDPAPFAVFDDEYYGGDVPSVASDGVDFLVARNRVDGDHMQVVAATVSAAGDVGPARVVSAEGTNPYGPVSLAWTGSNYLLGYDDNAPCQLASCPVWKRSIWVRAVSRDGNPTGPEVTIAKGEKVGGPRIGSTTGSNLVMWSDEASSRAEFVRSDGVPEGAPFATRFGGFPSNMSIPTDSARFYFSVGISDRSGFLALTPEHTVAMALPIRLGPPNPWRGVEAMALEGSGRPRMIISEWEPYGADRLYIVPSQLGPDRIDLAATIDGLPQSASAWSTHQVVLTFTNHSDTAATDVIAGVAYGNNIRIDDDACTTLGSFVTCNWPRFEPHETRSVHATIRVDDYFPGYNARRIGVSIGARELDEDATNNSVVAAYEITPASRTKPTRR